MENSSKIQFVMAEPFKSIGLKAYQLHNIQFDCQILNIIFLHYLANDFITYHFEFNSAKVCEK